MVDMNPWSKPPKNASATALDLLGFKGIYRARLRAEG